MKPKKIESWEKTRQKGAWRYGLIYGSIWGLFVVAFLTVINYFIYNEEDKLTASRLLIMTVIYLVTGILLYRFFMWKVNEKNYQKWLDEQEQNKQTEDNK